MVKELGFTAEYVDKLAPIDRRLYIMYFEKDREEERKRQTSNSSGVPLTNNIPADMG